MSNYNLSDNVQDGFTFNLRDKKYTMRYPRTEELEQVQDINERLEQAKVDKDETASRSASKELENFMYSFIEPTEGNDTPIQEALKKENIKVLQNFNSMIKKELAIQ